MQIHSASLAAMSALEQNSMFKLRHEVFSERLGWDVLSENGMERDAFDELPEARYIVGHTDDGRVDACWRLLPTTGPYMLKDTFPQLLGDRQAPCSQNIWELSRFAVATDRSGGGLASFGPLSNALLDEAAQFAAQNGIDCYVTVTTLAIERMVKQTGRKIQRIGPAMKVGNVMAVALSIE